MNNFTKQNIRELFSDSPASSYSVIMVEHRMSDGSKSDSSTLDQIHDATINLLNASFVKHYVEKNDTLLVCYLNYSPDIFSIRSFVASLRQTIYSMLPGTRSYIYYTQDIRDRSSLFAERFFLFNSVRYGSVLGCSKPIRSDYFRNCLDSPAKLNGNILITLFSDMNSKKYRQVLDLLSKQGTLFSDCQANSMYYEFNEMLQYLSDVHAALKLFFSLSNYHFSWMDMRIIDLLYSVNGAGPLFQILYESVDSYERTFTQAPVSEREKSTISEILVYVNSNLGSTNLTETALHFGLNQSYLCRLFKKNTGVNFNEYIRDKRFEQSLVLLRENTEQKMSIAQIAAMLGYKSQSHFQNSFKLKYGITPQGYRRNCHVQNFDS